MKRIKLGRGRLLATLRFRPTLLQEVRGGLDQSVDLAISESVSKAACQLNCRPVVLPASEEDHLDEERKGSSLIRDTIPASDKNMKRFIQCSLSPVRDLNPKSPKYEAEMLQPLY
jgi:hypothetical protein